MIRRFGPIALLALAVIAAPRVARAQEVATVPTPTLAPAELPVVSETPETPAAQPAVGPTLEGATVGFRRPVTQTAHAPVVVAAARGSNSATLMIVGGVAFLVGAVIADDNSTAGTVIMLGGAGIGLYGLYLYLQ
jgi:hypothetical protein